MTPGGYFSCSSTWDLVLALLTDTIWVFSPPSGKSGEFVKVLALKSNILTIQITLGVDLKARFTMMPLSPKLF